MKVNIKDHEIELQYCMRLFLKYEERRKASVTFEDLASYTSLSELLFCAVSATLEHKKYRDLNITLTWEEFVDWTDDLHPSFITNEFSKWLTDSINNQNEFIAETETEELTEEDKKKSKN